jgi:predicted nucleotide-binding protein
MYALGVRHSFGMPVIHVHTPSSTFPFDLDGLDAVVIDLADMSSAKRARKEIVARIEELDVERPSVSPVLATIELDVAGERRDDDAPISNRTVVNGIRALEQRIAMVQTLVEERTVPSIRTGTRSRRIFIVHGHDGELKHQLARVLDRLDFDVVILHELADSCRTLLEKLRTEVDDIGFVFVLFTPDDVAASHRDADQQVDRPRQNVIYEHGLFCGLLGADRVCSIQKGDVELPSDLDGLVVKRIPDGADLEAIQLDLLQELKRAGYDVDANQLMG